MIPEQTSLQSMDARAFASDDSVLVSETLSGNLAAFELLIRRYNRRLYRVTYSILGDVQAAEDCMQEAYVKAYRSLAKWGPPFRFGAWLSRIAANEALMYRRTAAQLTVVQPEEVEHLSQQQEAVMHTSDDPMSQLFSQQLKGVIEAAVLRLPPTYRSVFMLRMVEQLSVEETAEVLSIPAATVKTRLHRAKAMLQAMLEERLEAQGDELFEYAGSWCDQMVERVMRQLGSSPHEHDRI